MKKFLYSLLAAAILASGALLTGCSDSDDDPAGETPRENQFIIALVDDSYALDYEGSMTLRALKFTDGDGIALTAGERGESSERIPVTIEGFTPTDVSFRIPKEVTTGRWTLWCLRGGAEQCLGTTTLEVDIFRLVRNVRLESAYGVDRGDVLTLPGEGFAAGDRIRFAAAGQSGTEAEITSLDAAGITLRLPATLATGVWEVWIDRGAESQLLGITELTVSAFERIDPASLP